MELLKEAPRKLDPITEPNQRVHVLQKHLIGKELILKDDTLEHKLQITQTNQDGSRILAFPLSPYSYRKGQPIVLFKVLGKYIQLDGWILEQKDDGNLLIRIDNMWLAKDSRSEARIPNNGSMHASHLRTTKAVIHANMFQIPTLVKVAFDEFRSKLDPKVFEFVKINVFQASLPRRFSIVKKTGRPLLIQDTQSRDSYFPKDPHFLSYEKDIDEEVEAEMASFQEEMILSEAIVPILYSDEMRKNPFPIGYIGVQTKERKLTPEDTKVLEQTAKAIVKRIHESNVVEVDKRFPVLDASPSGLRIGVQDQELIELLPKQNFVVVDIYFPLQPPFTVLGDIRWVGKKSDQEIMVGLHLDAKSDNPGERNRYIRNLQSLSQEIESEKLQKK